MTGDTVAQGDTVEAITVEHRPPEEVFGLLADDTRIEILGQLGETPDKTVSFSNLRERVGTADSGQFNYHLTQLQGSFVRKTDGGYTLTHAGQQVVGAIYAGTYTADATVDPVATGVECPVCESNLVAEYGDETTTISCECGEPVEYFFPPGAVDEFDTENLPAAFYRWRYLDFQRTLAGFCPVCSGRIDGELLLDGDSRRATSLPADAAAETAHVEFECKQCETSRRVLATSPVLVHPAVGGFLADHGIDVRTTPIWQIRDAIDRAVALRSTDPPRVEVRFTCEDETVMAVVTGDGSVDDVERADGDGAVNSTGRDGGGSTDDGGTASGWRLDEPHRTSPIQSHHDWKSLAPER